MAMRPAVTSWEAVEFALFFSFSALNLVWFPLRNVSNAIDEFITFETLEATRRIGHIAAMLALLIGLPLLAFLVLVNLIWAVVFAICAVHLVRKGALTRCLVGFWATLRVFWHANKKLLLRSGNYAVGELVVYNFPYFVVPLVFGLGAPTIILDTVFKVFRGATLIYAAGLDPLVPKQTRAFAEHDAPTLKKATLTATVLCAVPTVLLCLALLFAGDRLFALLLGHAATVPGPAVFILIVLLLANMAQNVASSLLLHTGFFRRDRTGCDLPGDHDGGDDDGCHCRRARHHRVPRRLRAGLYRRRDALHQLRGTRAFPHRRHTKGCAAVGASL